jgi:hypothetical protein
MVLPIEAYYLSASEEYNLVNHVHIALVEACMRDLGFDTKIEELPAGGRLLAGHGGLTYRRYAGVYDPQVAAVWGYHRPEDIDPNWVWVNPYSEAEQLAMAGDLSEYSADGSRLGCYGKADQQLSEGLEYMVAGGLSWAEPVRQLALAPSYEEDPRVLAAQAAWSKCMAEAGYQLEHTLADLPIELVNFDIFPVPQVEIDMALQDVSCQQQTGVVQIVFEVETEFQLQVIEQNAEVFAQIFAEKEEVLRRAAALLEQIE